MGEIVEIDAFKARRIAKLEAEREALLDRIEALQKDSKLEHAKPLIAKVTALGAELRRLKGVTQKPKTALDEYPDPYEGFANFEYTFRATLVDHKRPEETDSTS